MDNTLVSIVMIFLDAERFIREAIESVFAQTFGGWELLLVDDGSMDSSTAIARRYAQEHPWKVRYLEHEGHRNRGMSASRNLGIRSSRGEFIAFLDSDDVWLPRKLERQVAILRSRPEVAMVCGPTQLWYSWTGSPGDAQRDAMRELGVQPDTLFEPPILLSLLLNGLARTPSTCGVLLRRGAIEAVCGFEESFRGMFEDQAFFAKVYHKLPTFVSGECWDRYRQHPESCCHMADDGCYHRARFAFLSWLDEYLPTQGFEDAELRRALRQALWPYRYPNLHRLTRLAVTFPAGWIHRIWRRRGRIA